MGRTSGKVGLAIGAVAIIMAMTSVGVFAGDEEEGPTASLNFLVLKEANGKPIKAASVILHPVNAKGKQERGGYQLKTDPEGKTNFDGVPYGKLRVQVLAQGFQTFGEDYSISGPTVSITIKLKRPQGQFSIYDDPSGGQKKESEKKPQ